MKVRVINLSYEATPYKKIVKSSATDDIKKWGCDNRLPEDILYLYHNSPTNSGIINRKAKLMAGNEYKFSNPDADFFAIDINFSELFYKVCLDYSLYHTFCLEAISKTYVNKIADIKYQDASLVRLTDNTEKLAISTDWSDGQCKIEYVNAFDINNSNIQEGFLFYTTDGPGVANYAYPTYWAGMKSIEAEIELINYQLALIKNSFMPSGILKLPSTLSDEEFDLTQKTIKKELTGASKAGKILTITSDGDKSIEWIPLSQTKDVSGLREDLAEARQSIIIAHNLPSPVIIGLPGGASLSGDANTINSAYLQYFNNEVLPDQHKIKKVFERLFAAAGYPTEINIVNSDTVIATV